MEPEGIPDWVATLGAAPCSPTVATWGRWSTHVTTYCTTFEAAYSKRNKQEWASNWGEEYGKVILRPRTGSDRTVAEFEVVKAFHEAGWGANWQDG